ncbi:MAG: DUF2239 family protein [Gemmatimonadaceae bacterium]
MTSTSTEPVATYTAFAGNQLIATGSKGEVITALKHQEDSIRHSVLIFDNHTGREVDFDLSGSLAEVLEREAAAGRHGPGRPKLGVIGREVSLLPRHWEWLEEQPNGISAALRRLVDEARKREPGAQKARRMRAALSRVMWAMAGDLPNFEEATRALFAPDDEQLAELTCAWPHDVRAHVLRLAGEATRAEQS